MSIYGPRHINKFTGHVRIDWYFDVIDIRAVSNNYYICRDQSKKEMLISGNLGQNVDKGEQFNTIPNQGNIMLAQDRTNLV